jgi:phage/plasmid-associated DNA primase
MRARMIFSSEASTEWELHADQIKSLTGGDSISVRDLYGNADDMTNQTPECTPVLATNAVPTIIGADEAIWRRLIVFWLGNTIEARREDPELVARVIAEEGPQVLAWLLEGYEMYNNGVWLEQDCDDTCDIEEAHTHDFLRIERGLDDMPAEVMTATMAFRSNLTTADQHIYSDNVRRDPGNREVHEKAATLYASYRQWCVDSGIPTAKIQTKGKYLEALERAGHTEDKYEVPAFVSPAGVAYKARQYRARTGIAVNTEYEMNRNVPQDAKPA